MSKKKALPEKHTEVMHGTILLLLLSHKMSPKYSTGLQTAAKSIRTVHTWRCNGVGLETNTFAERVERHKKREMSRPLELQVASDYRSGDITPSSSSDHLSLHSPITTQLHWCEAVTLCCWKHMRARARKHTHTHSHTWWIKLCSDCR